MIPQRDDSTDDDPRVIVAAREYLADLEAGLHPDRKAYLARDPDLASVLEEAFDGVELAHAAGAALSPFPDAGPTLQPAAPLGDFNIVREIGRGGMGVVYEAIQISLGRRVALKVLPFASALDPRQLRRFQTEAHAAAQLHHTNIVPVYAVGCERGTHFYAMQLIEGRSLDAVIRQLRGGEPGEATTGSTIELREQSTSPTAPRSPTTAQISRQPGVYRSAARLIAQAARALEYAHDAGVIHRDVKPGNLLLDGKGNIWITDFGLALVSTEAGPTRTGDLLGTLGYMSPEQAAGRRAQVDHRTDVYSLGATLYELLTLQPMFPGPDRQALLHQILHQEPRQPRQIDRGIPVELETIVLKSVAKAPEDRYSTAGEMAADLSRFLENRPILARRPSLIDRARKWLRRHPTFLAASVLVLVFAVLSLATAAALILHEQHLTDQAYSSERAAHNREKEAHEREKERSAEADERFQLARASADEMIRIANEELANDPNQQTLRGRLLQSALTFYEQLIELRHGDSEAQEDLNQTRMNVELILADLAVIRGAQRHGLLMDSDVQKDLALNLDQKQKIDVIRAEIDASRQDKREDGRAQLLKEMKEHEAAIGKILTSSQFHRLGQIALQVRGLEAFREPEAIAKLGLTRDQRKQINEIDSGPGGWFGPRSGPNSDRGGPPERGRDGPEGHRPGEMGRGFNDRMPPPDGPRGKLDPGRDRPNAKKNEGGPGSMGPKKRDDSQDRQGPMVRVLKILTPEQLATWQELIGKPFEWKDSNQGRMQKRGP